MAAAEIERLRETDQRLAQDSPLWSLCPGRERATPLAVLGETLLAPTGDAGVAGAFADGLSAVALAVQRSFPGNLFWDFDYLATTLLDARRLTSVSSAGTHAAAIGEVCSGIVALQDLFSHRSNIQFRYAHDFLYGFDWAKWVSRDPGARASVRAFEPAFLRGMYQRGSEILDLIAQNDDKYPDLPHGRDRNPFRFARDPEAERVLHCDLADRGFIPVSAWSTSAAPDWNRPYAEYRKQRAHALGLDASPNAT